jgi:flagellar biosynthesis activator protein FlaF
MLAKQIEAYRTVQKTTMTGREIEASVLTKGALMLQQCQNNWDAADRGANLDAAIKYNQSIWSIFESELAKPDNPLPKRLREDVLSLGIFINKQIFDIMLLPSPDKLTSIININMRLATGLRASGA